jgi:phytoene synthase
MIRMGRGDSPIVKNVLGLVERFPAIREPLAALVESCRDDTDALVIKDEADLERYAHGVAGNVGLIMYPILGGEAPEGLLRAADLGIAMQYTNIARDVREDLLRGRVYLPSDWLGTIDPRGLLLGDKESHEHLSGVVSRLLSLARARYERGLRGVCYLAPESQYAIRVAARCYAAIGDRVLRDGRLVSERAVVPFRSKVALALKERFPRAEKTPSSVCVR